MPKTIRAWRIHQFGDMRLDEVPCPEAKPGWAVVKVKVVQPSVTDAVRAMGLETFGSDRIARMIAEGQPVQLGHEFCGEVVEVGEGVEELRVGDRVCTMGPVSCGQCPLCRKGLAELCHRGGSVGTNIPGAFAEYTTIPARGLVKVPESLTDHEVTCLQPLSSCVASVESARIKMGDTVVVLGQGVMGLGVMQVARASGAGTLITIDVREESLELSKRFGADVTLNARTTDPVQAVLDLTQGLGADIVLEAAGGSPQQGLAGFTTLNQAIAMVREQGTIVEVANLTGTLELNPRTLRQKSIRYIFPILGTTRSLTLAARLVASRRVDVASTITHILQGIEKVPEAIEITANKAQYRATNPAQVVVA